MLEDHIHLTVWDISGREGGGPLLIHDLPDFKTILPQDMTVRPLESILVGTGVAILCFSGKLIAYDLQAAPEGRQPGIVELWRAVTHTGPTPRSREVPRLFGGSIYISYPLKNRIEVREVRTYECKYKVVLEHSRDHTGEVCADGDNLAVPGMHIQDNCPVISFCELSTGKQVLLLPSIPMSFPWSFGKTVVSEGHVYGMARNTDSYRQILFIWRADTGDSGDCVRTIELKSAEVLSDSSSFTFAVSGGLLATLQQEEGWKVAVRDRSGGLLQVLDASVGDGAETYAAKVIDVFMNDGCILVLTENVPDFSSIKLAVFPITNRSPLTLEDNPKYTLNLPGCLDNRDMYRRLGHVWVTRTKVVGMSWSKITLYDFGRPRVKVSASSSTSQRACSIL